MYGRYTCQFEFMTECLFWISAADPVSTVQMEQLGFRHFEWHQLNRGISKEDKQKWIDTKYYLLNGWDTWFLQQNEIGKARWRKRPNTFDVVERLHADAVSLQLSSEISRAAALLPLMMRLSGHCAITAVLTCVVGIRKGLHLHAVQLLSPC